MSLSPLPYFLEQWEDAPLWLGWIITTIVVLILTGAGLIFWFHPRWLAGLVIAGIVIDLVSFGNRWLGR